MPAFIGGPADGTGSFDPRVDTAAPQGPPGLGAGDPADAAGNGGPDAQNEQQLFDQVLSGIRGLLGARSLSQSSTLLVSKAETLLQQVKAAEEKEQQGALQGKLSPGLMQRAYGG